VRRPRRRKNARGLEPDRIRALAEEAGAAAEQDRGHVHLQLVDEPRSQRLLNRRATARDRDVVVTGRDARLLDGCLDPLRDEKERRPALHLHRFPGVMGEDEDGDVKGRLLAPPSH
jgi:hypothetical protein